MFYFEEINGKKFLKSDMLPAEHLFTTRDSFIKTKEEEFEPVVETNKKMICKHLDVKKLLTPSQTHTNFVDIAKSNKDSYPDTDGLILADKGNAIFLNFADCTPLIIYDKVKNIGAVSHAGWRGTAGKIAKVTVNKMVDEFRCNPLDMVAAIGPAISMCCYNVGQEVYDKLKLTVSDFSGLSENRDGNIYVDLKGINRRQLEECGISQIDVCPYCTCCNNDIFFSYRKENGTTNRHSAILKLS